VRLVVAPDAQEGTRRVVIDRTRTLPGRGAYVCRAALGDAPNRECLRLATRSRRLTRTLRSQVPISAELVESLTGA
jgi:predicted RNA-binding protein YlxR (DUF448 family)